MKAVVMDDMARALFKALGEEKNLRGFLQNLVIDSEKKTCTFEIWSATYMTKTFCSGRINRVSGEMLIYQDRVRNIEEGEWVI